MKLTNFKLYSLIIAVLAFLTLSGCGGGTTGIVSDSSSITTPVPDMTASTVTASPTTVAADGTTPSTITVTVNDVNSNPIIDATVNLDQGAGSSTISSVTNVGDGTYTFDVTSTTAEIVTYTATADGVTITQTADVTFKVGIADAGTSTVTASPDTITADGTTTSTITVTVNDVNSNPITDATVTLDQGNGSSTISAVTNVGDGTYTFNVTSTTADTVTYTATADGVTITQTAGVTFTQTTAEATCLSGAGAAGYGIITINGRNWLDRNLGALQVAVATNDPDAYGDLYQWGRSTEGHQVRTSDINDTLATTLDSVQNTDWEGKFIVGANDWAVTTLDNNGSIRSQSWSTPYDVTNNPNQVCPCGYVVPTIQDFRDLNMTVPNATDTFKLTTAGWRENIDGNITQENSRAYFWTTTTVAPNRSTVYGYITSSNSEDQYEISKRANGYSIRCIKPQ